MACNFIYYELLGQLMVVVLRDSSSNFSRGGHLLHRFNKNNFCIIILFFLWKWWLYIEVRAAIGLFTRGESSAAEVATLYRVLLLDFTIQLEKFLYRKIFFILLHISLLCWSVVWLTRQFSRTVLLVNCSLNLYWNNFDFF